MANEQQRDVPPHSAGTLYRSMTIELSPEQRAVDEKARTVELAFSSEEPYERLFGLEVLDHGSGAVRMERLRNGAALLLQHDASRQIGVVEEAHIGRDRRGRARVRFGRGPLAEEIFTDVRDGIRRHVSVGYRVHEMVLVEHGQDVDTYRVTDWEPMELSIVSVPADASVGVGRAAHHPPQPRQHHQEINTMPEQTRDDVLDDERGEEERTAEDIGQGEPDEDHRAERTAEDEAIRRLGRQFSETALAEEWIELGGSVDDMRADLLKRRRASKPQPVPAARDVRVEMRMQRHQPLRGFRNEEDAYRAGQWVMATIYGNERAARWCRDHYVRAGTTATVAGGGAIVPEQMAQAIIDLRNQYGAARQLCRLVPMASDTLTVPRAVSDMTGYWGSQNTSMTDSDVAWDQVQLVAKKLYAYCKLSTEYVEDAAIDVAGDLVTRMARVFAQKEDEAFINGDGTSTYGGIYGLRPKIINGSHTAGAVDAATGVDTYAEVTNTDITSALGKVPSYARPGSVILCSPVARDVVFSRLSAASGGTTMTELGGMPRPSYLGRPIVESDVMPASTGDLSNVVMLLMGNFGLSSTMGERRGFTVAVDTSVHFQSDQIAVRGTERVDIVNHDLGDTSDAGPVVALVGE